MAELKPRSKNLNELADSTLYLFRVRPLLLDEGAKKLLDDEGRKLLAQARAALASTTSWTSDALDTTVRGVAEAAGVGLGKVAQPLRAVLTGQAKSPGIFDVLLQLGRDESIGRIDDQL